MKEGLYTVDNDKSVGYENITFTRKFIDIFFVAFLNSLPSNFSKLIKKSERSAKEVIDNKTSHHALEVLYNHGFPRKGRNPLQSFFLKVWFNLHNSKAVRNRLKLVKKEIKEIIKEADRRTDDIKVISIASGSARAVIEALSEVSPIQNKVSAIFLDKSPKALEYSKFLKEKLINFENNWQFSWVEDTASNFNKYAGGQNSLNLVEIVGLLDYFSSEKVLEILTSIYEHLSPGGVMVAANITDNRERKFITNVVGWPMIYKDPDEMINLATQAGFKKENIRAVYEPLEIHLVLIAKK